MCVFDSLNLSISKKCSLIKLGKYVKYEFYEICIQVLLFNS